MKILQTKFYKIIIKKNLFVTRTARGYLGRCAKYLTVYMKKKKFTKCCKMERYKNDKNYRQLAKKHICFYNKCYNFFNSPRIDSQVGLFLAKHVGLMNFVRYVEMFFFCFLWPIYGIF